MVSGCRKPSASRYANNGMADLEARFEGGKGLPLFGSSPPTVVFSMDGIIANLQGVLRPSLRNNNAMVMVDDSHAVWLRRQERSWLGRALRVSRVGWDIITGTLGKALGGASGGLHLGQEPGGRLATASRSRALSLFQHADAGDRRRPRSRCCST